MQLNQISMRAVLITAIAAMDFMRAVLASGHVWQDFALESQRATVNEQARAWIANLRKEFDNESREIAQIAKSDPELMAAVRKQNIPVASSQLNKLSQHPFFKTGESDLIALQVLDGNFNPIAGTPADSLDTDPNQVSCQNLRAQAARRIGSERLKPMGGICIVGKEMRYEFFQSLGENSSDGYLKITYNMLHNFTAAESALAGLITCSACRRHRVVRLPVGRSRIRHGSHHHCGTDAECLCAGQVDAHHRRSQRHGAVL
jgi:hypothetical protein